MGRINWRKYGLLIFSLPVVVLLFCASAFSSFLAPYDPYYLDVMDMLEGPSSGHLFGTDELGRDVLSRTIYASQISIVVGLIAVAIGMTGGTVIGVTAAYFGGLIDNLLMRLMDILFSFPAILLAVILMANIGTSILNAMLAIGIIFIPGFARLTRAVTQTVQRQQYLEAAICIGVSGPRLIWREILPNVCGPVVVEAAVAFSYAVLLESALSFLGLGAQPPLPEWGAMISDGRTYILDYWWVAAMPGIAIFTVSMAFNLLGDGLRDVLDPKGDKS